MSFVSPEIERLGPYRIVGKLGRGGMGTVYEGVHEETGEPAAVKLLSAALAQEEGFRGRFEAEIETLRKLNHPNVVRLFGFGQQEGHLFYSMELVDGNSLEEELRRGRQFDWREVTRIGVETCRALRHAHDRGIIHRDIKPGNLLLAADGHVKLSDFGIARLFGNTRLTGAGNVLGTAEYMAPEQAEGRPVDTRADLYSLGALMYALLARRPVFRGKSLPDMLHKQRFEQPEPVRKYAPDTPAELEQIIAQLLDKDPGKRIPNPDLLARRLEAMLHALSLGAETLEAGRSWFFPDPSAVSAGPDEPLLSPDDVPVTQALDGGGGEAKGRPGALPPALPTPSGKPAGSTPAAGRAGFQPAVAGGAGPQSTAASGRLEAGPTVDRFVVVPEEELDRGQKEERRPTFSWQTGALAAALLLVGLGAWWALQPPTADTLYDRIAAKTADQSIGSILQAEGDIRDFLNRYSNDSRAGRVREYQREIELRNLENKFNQRVKGLASAKSLEPIERAYLEAINYVHLDPEIGMAKLAAIVDLYDRPGSEKEPAGQCLTLVRRRLAQLRQEVAKRSADQLQLLEERLGAADALRADDPAQARKMYQAVVELYAGKPWAAAAIRRAREALGNMPKPEAGKTNGAAPQ
jgi:serine/threonine-protein kinase